MSRGQCSVADCEKSLGWNGMCPMHATRVARHGDPQAFVAISDRRHRRGDESGRWVAEDATYSGVHQRLRVSKGLAATHPCIDCGEPAAQWSYDNADPDERTDGGHPYSLDPDHYAPRCTSCHRKFDGPMGAAKGRPIDLGAVVQLHAEGVGATRMARQLQVSRERIARLHDDLGLPRLKGGGPGTPWKKCRHGHEYTPENTLANGPAGRRCRTCYEASVKRKAVRRAERNRTLRAKASAKGVAA